MKSVKRIEAVYCKLKAMHQGKGISALALADAMGLSRANVSSDLNQLCREGKVTKSDGRPTLFAPGGSIAEAESSETTLDKLVKAGRSLATAVEQAKAAILYPPRGMHALILGETGVGKSMFAGMMHKYAVEMGKLAKNAPFITFNCADYSNNPQLLISQLFGVKKGAYTGADVDRKGLIEKADGGILFLDEVHRLPAEGQEMFFTFMDKGRFRRLGETEEERSANVLIISATTENPESSLLRTFTRRIPMIIRLPQLKERSIEERFGLILLFLKEEARRLDREILVSTNAMRAFLSYNCPNNIGQLKSDIQLACAKAYADYVSYRKECIYISTTDLAGHVKEGLLNTKDHRNDWGKLLSMKNNYYVINPNQAELEDGEMAGLDNVYELIDARVEELKSRGVSQQELEAIMERDIENYFNQFLYGIDKRFKKSNLANIVDPLVISLVEELVKFSEARLDRVLSQKVCLGMALHIQTLVERRRRNESIINPQLNHIRSKYRQEFNLALECSKLIEKRLDISLPVDEAGFLTMFFILDNEKHHTSNGNVGVIVLAHGSATASSMAEVANKLLGVDYAVGINMPLDISPEEILHQLRTCIGTFADCPGFLLLVDMGSLTTFGSIIEKETDIPVRVVSLASTPHVLEATRKAMLGYALEEIYQDVLGITTFNEASFKAKREAPVSSRLAIVTVCLTGEGSAIALKSFLENHLRLPENLFEVIPVNLIGTENIQQRLKKISEKMDIACIVTSFHIDTKVPQFHIQEVLNLKAVSEIQDIVNIQSTYLKMGSTIKYHLKNVDGERVYTDVKHCIALIEEALHVKLSVDSLIGIVLHISCMVDRLKGGGVVVKYCNAAQYITDNRQAYQSIRTALNYLEEKYQINITDNEICYVMNFFEIKEPGEYGL